MKIKDYTTLIKPKPSDLDTAVKSKIRLGWQPYGNPYVTKQTTANGEQTWLLQCMVKYEE